MPVAFIPDIQVIKSNTAREEVWLYEGRILEQSAESIMIEAFFNGGSRPFHGSTW
jgi:hypothetical protein